MKTPPKYSHPEIERRWLVDLRAVGDMPGESRLVEDRYVGSSRLRLRKVTGPAGEVELKLGKKYGKTSPRTEPVTSLYLSPTEFAHMAMLGGTKATKRRYAIAGGSLDIYKRPRRGLAIFEIEFEDEASAAAYVPPPFVTREITADRSFDGAEIARSSGVAKAVRRMLRSRVGAAVFGMLTFGPLMGWMMGRSQPGIWDLEGAGVFIPIVAFAAVGVCFGLGVRTSMAALWADEPSEPDLPTPAAKG